MIEKLYHTESYTEPVNSIIKKVNELVTAVNSGTQPASTNNRYATALNKLKLHTFGNEAKAWNEAVDRCIKEVERLNADGTSHS
jgi:hypothetical protein